MPAIPSPDIVATRQDQFGRHAVFHEPAPSLTAPLGWRAVTLDEGEQTETIQVRLDERDDPGAAAWTTRDILRVALARQLAEVARSGDVMASSSASHLSSAPVSLQHRPRLAASTYHHAGARADILGLLLDYCFAARHRQHPAVPRPCGGEGVSPEMLLHVLDQLLADAVHGIRADRHLRAAARQVAAGLQQEILRVRARCEPDRL